MGHIHGVFDSDAHFKIDHITRAIKNETSNAKTKIIQYDHNSERFSFELPRYIEGHDMLTCNVVQVHYINIGAGNKKNTGLYEIDDLQASPEDENVVVCSWLISQNATQLVGTMNFVLRFVCTTNGEIDYVWNTAVYNAIIVAEVINNTDVVLEEYPDVLEQWRKKLELATVEKSIGDFDMLGYRVKNVGDPVDDGDAVNKAYIRGIVNGKMNAPVLLLENLPDPIHPAMMAGTVGTSADPTQFDYLNVIYRPHSDVDYETDDNGYLVEPKIPLCATGWYPVSLINEGKPLAMEEIIVAGDTVMKYRRLLDGVTSEGFHFTDAVNLNGVGGSLSYLIPYQVYGVNSASVNGTESDAGGNDNGETPAPDSGGNTGNESGGNVKNGIPPGGKIGQYLCKRSNEDYDVAWSDLIIPEQYGLVSYDQDKIITIT